jgi:hypothetical protein
MFKRGRWFRSHIIYSDEGFSVVIWKDGLLYREHERKMSVTSEWTLNGFAVSTITIGRWDDDLGNAVDEKEKHRIADNIRRALESQGYSVTLL